MLGWRLRIIGHFDARRIVEVEVLLRRDERQVRLQETDGEEEGLILECAQRGDRLTGGLAIGERVVRDIRRFVKGTCSRNGGLDLPIALAQAFVEVPGGVRTFGGIPRRATGPPPGNRPAARVIESAMENLREAGGRVALLAKTLRQCDGIRQIQAEVRLKFIDFGRVGSEARE